mmetsp:Transcript_20257/g.80905  ORF Transcript_20257/g.80905 Transcript_20257/m.80905 type:complete len:216 (-) Transcript_20257:322-969(-)
MDGRDPKVVLQQRAHGRQVRQQPGEAEGRRTQRPEGRADAGIGATAPKPREHLAPRHVIGPAAIRAFLRRFGSPRLGQRRRRQNGERRADGGEAAKNGAPAEAHADDAADRRRHGNRGEAQRRDDREHLEPVLRRLEHVARDGRADRRARLADALHDAKRQKRPDTPRPRRRHRAARGADDVVHEGAHECPAAAYAIGERTDRERRDALGEPVEL